MVVLSDVKPALEQILSHMHGVPIEVRQLAETIPTQREYAAFAATNYRNEIRERN